MCTNIKQQKHTSYFLMTNDNVTYILYEPIIIITKDDGNIMSMTFDFL